jgi:6-pyruvoyltetrahydropterin/6-carboxytetrahydropterin synthase
MYELMVEKNFAAAHYLKNYNGKCENMHGHNYKVQIFVKGNELDPEVGYLIDFKILKKELQKVLDKIEHTTLNEVLDFNPTAELLAKYIYENLHENLHKKLNKVTVWENADTSATYYT